MGEKAAGKKAVGGKAEGKRKMKDFPEKMETAMVVANAGGEVEWEADEESVVPKQPWTVGVQKVDGTMRRSKAGGSQAGSSAAGSSTAGGAASGPSACKQAKASGAAASTKRARGEEEPRKGKKKFRATPEACPEDSAPAPQLPAATSQKVEVEASQGGTTQGATSSEGALEGIAAVEACLKVMRLEQYCAALDALGYDDLAFLAQVRRRMHAQSPSCISLIMPPL